MVFIDSFTTPSYPSKENHSRDLQETQNIFFIFHGVQSPTESPSGAPTVEPRNVNYRVCGDGSQDVTGVANVHFVYDIEVNSLLSSVEEEIVLETLERSMLDSIMEASCQRRLDGERRLEIETVSSGARDTFRGECVATVDDSESCNRYDGTISVGYNEMGDNDSMMLAGNAALQIVSENMNLGYYLDAVNTALGLSVVSGAVIGNSTSVTKINYVGTTFYNANDGNQVFAGLQSGSYTLSTNGGLTKLGKYFVPVVGVLFIGMIAACYLTLKSFKRQRHDKWSLGEPQDDSMFFDRESISGISGPTCSLDGGENNHTTTKGNLLDLDEYHYANPTKYSQPTFEGYGTDAGAIAESKHAQSVEILDPGTRSRKGSLFRFLRNRTKLPTIEVLDEVTDADVRGNEDSVKERFEDEPVVEDLEPFENEVDLGALEVATSREVVDNAGFVRNEIEL